MAIQLGYVSGHRIRADLVPQTAAMIAAAARDGVTLRITQGWRSDAEQVAIFLARYTPRATGSGPFGDVRWWNGVRYVRTSGAAAAVPGESTHGKGQAIDFATDSPGAIAWLTKNGAKYGWARPAWTFTAPTIEPWHWEAARVVAVSNPIGGVGAVPTVPNLPALTDLEEDMPTAEEIAAAVWNHQVAYQGAGPAPAYVFLADARGFGIKAVDSIGTLPAAVWGHEITHDGAGPAPTAVFLADARAFAIRAVDAIGNLTVKPLDADAVAAALAPLLAANMTGLSDADLTAIKKIVQDEADRRARAGLAQ